MKKILLGILISVVGLLLPTAVFAQTDFDHVRLFTSDITLNQDASIDVKETVDYHFSTYRHGIYREIPTNYKTAGSFTRPTILRLNNLYYYRTSNPNDTYHEYERTTSNGYTVLKIGDAEETIIGEYTYIIDYKLTYAVNYFDDHDELYINVTGNGWEVPIRSVVANISLPADATDYICYTGALSSTASDCTIDTSTGKNRLKVTAGPFEIYEGLTVVASMPKGTIADTTGEQRVQALIANLGILLPIPVAVLAIFLSKKYNKNKKITVIPHYNAPKGVNPLLAAYVYKKNVPNSAISAQIIQFAIDKYLKIKQLSKKDYELQKLEKDSPSENTEKKLYDALFETDENVSLKKLSTKFFSAVASLRSLVDKEAYDSEYFSRQQKKISNTYAVISSIGLFVVFTTAALFIENAAMSWFWGLLLSLLVMIIFAVSIDKRAKKGNELYYELEGLKMYINTAEKHRIEFHNDPKKYLGVFEKLLPYAIIFGLEKKWAKEFEDLYDTPPEWYEGNTNLFNSYILASSLTSMNQQIVSRANATNSAHGFSSSHGGFGGSGFSGGSSGGGFGGGGGGSW